MAVERLAIEGGTPVRTRPFGPTHDFGDEDVAALAEVIRSGNVGKGPKVRAFEEAFAARHGVRHAVAVTSGTAAMHVCVGAINPDPGDEVIVTPWTVGGSFIGVLLHNCVPVFADVDDTFTLDPADVAAKITPRTRAIIAVHLFGNACDLDPLREIARRHGIVLVEDCCQAHFTQYRGRFVGSIGDIAGFSFGGKHLSAGTGGCVLTSDETIWERAVLFSDAALPRAHGPYARRPYANYFLAPNYRLNDVIAALLLSQLKKVDGYIARKVAIARQMTEQLADLPEITPQRVRPEVRHTYLAYAFTIDTAALGVDTRTFVARVNAEGIPLLGPYVGTGEEGPAYRNPFLTEPNCYGVTRFPFDYGRDRPYDYRHVACPRGEELMGRSCYILLFSTYSDRDVADIVAAIRKVALACRERRARERRREPVGVGG